MTKVERILENANSDTMHGTIKQKSSNDEQISKDMSATHDILNRKENQNAKDSFPPIDRNNISIIRLSQSS